MDLPEEDALRKQKHTKEGIDMKVLSIAVPCYNSEEYLDRCMATLLPGGKDVEILIVNDGSKDSTPQIAQRYAEEYPDIVRVINKENGGHGDAVMYGLANATGAFFKVVDSDDSLDADAYRKVLDFLKKVVRKKVALDMLITNFVYDKHGEDRVNQKVIDYRDSLPTGKFFRWKDAGKFKTGHYLLMHAVIYRTQLLRSVDLDLPKHTFYVDNIYVYKPLPYVKTMYYLDVELYLYYTGREDQSVNTQVMMKRIDQQDRVNRIMFDAFDLEKIENANCRRYMYQYLQIMCTVTSAFYALHNTDEMWEKKKKLWSDMKTKNPAMWRKLRFGDFQGIAVNIPGRLGRFLVGKGYFAAQKIFKFN